ncbi:putative glutathione S-transferase [Nemania sp. NC0429]|nr:putative glutathione S-transferase [Nemania sp. NC0429]
MTLIVHHLLVSQSERAVWLCEELGIDYELKIYPRCPIQPPPEYLRLYPLELSPIIQDGHITLAESAACMEYITQIKGGGRFIIPPEHKDFANYVYWFHFVNATFQPALMRCLTMKCINNAVNGVDPPAKGAFMKKQFIERLAAMLSQLDERLAQTPWLSGEQFSLADIMVVYSLTTVRCFVPYHLTSYPNILAYLKRVSARDGYRRAKQKSDPEMDIALLIGTAPPTWQPAYHIINRQTTPATNGPNGR